ncbi:thiamine-phosphate kinase, partial [Candidatus Dependentiae bacterium]|nr:thiamine-phosphate kinase [Candidatus Dependentiae bacterium]
MKSKSKNKSNSEFSELKFLDIIEKKFKYKDKDLIIGIGDDAAVLKFKNENIIATTDMMVENVHFNLKYFSIMDLAYKLVAVNVSDLIAMGADPKFALISIAVPRKNCKEFLLKFSNAIRSVLKRFFILLVGGDTVSSEKLVLNLTLLGEKSKGKPLLRPNAKAGDLIFCTGYPGLSGLGLKVLKSSKEKDKYINSVKRHLRPEPRIEFVRDFVKGIKQIGGVIDISDGLVIDLYRILKASNKGAELYESGIPIHPELRKYFKSKTKIFDLIFYGGEDFELIFTINKKFKEKVIKIAKRVKVPIS